MIMVLLLSNFINSFCWLGAALPSQPLSKRSSTLPICSKPVPFEQQVVSLANHEHRSISMTSLYSRGREKDEEGCKELQTEGKMKTKSEKQRMEAGEAMI